MQSTQPQSASDPPPRPLQPPQKALAYTHTDAMTSAGNMSAHSGAALSDRNGGRFSTSRATSHAGAGGAGSSMPMTGQPHGHTMTTHISSTPVRTLNIAPSAAAAVQQGPVPPPAGPSRTNSIMTFREIDAVATPSAQPQPPPATRLNTPTAMMRPPREFHLRNKVPALGSVDDSAMVHYMIATGFLPDPSPHYLYDEEQKLLIPWYKHEHLKKLNELLDLDKTRGAGIVSNFVSINKNSAKRDACPHQDVLVWCRTGLRKKIHFRGHPHWVQYLRTYTASGELRIYDLMELITQEHHRVHSTVTVGTVTYTAPSDIAAIWSSWIAQQDSSLAPPPALTVAAPPTAAPFTATSSGAMPPIGMWPTTTWPAATSSSAAISEIEFYHTLQVGMPDATAPQQVYTSRVKRNAPRSVQQSSRAASEAGTPVRGTGGITSQPTDERLAEPVAAHPELVLKKPGKRQAEEEVQESARPSKEVLRHKQSPVPEVTLWSPAIEHDNPGKRKAEVDLDENKRPSKMTRIEELSGSDTIPMAIIDLDYPNDLPKPLLEISRNDGAQVDGAHSPHCGSEKRKEALKTRPRDPFDLSNSVNNFVPLGCLDQSLIDKWIAELREITWTEEQVWMNGTVQKDLAPDTGNEFLECHLVLLGFPGEALAPLFRDLAMPDDKDFTELARCIRFARSTPQKNVDWRVYPFHVMEIDRRTNVYGVELLRSRNSVASEILDGVDWAAEHRAEVVLRYAKSRGKDLDLTAANIDMVYVGLGDEDRLAFEFPDEGSTGRDIVEHVRSGGTIPKESLTYLGLEDLGA